MNRLLRTIFSRPQKQAIAPARELGERQGEEKRVYLAGRYARREELREVARDLTERGFQVTSRWLFEDASIPGGVLAPEGRASEIAEMDFDDVRRADICIAFTEPDEGPQGRGGRHAELGIALALGQRVLLVGPREHVFHCLREVEQYDEWSEARQSLAMERSLGQILQAA